MSTLGCYFYRKAPHQRTTEQMFAYHLYFEALRFIVSAQLPTTQMRACITSHHLVTLARLSPAPPALAGRQTMKYSPAGKVVSSAVNAIYFHSIVIVTVSVVAVAV